MVKNIFLLIIAFILVTILSPIIFLVNLICRKDLDKYFKSIAIGLDQLGGSILYSQPDWTISSWTFFLAHYKKRKPAKIFMKFIDSIFVEGHCKRSFFHELQINNLPTGD